MTSFDSRHWKPLRYRIFLYSVSLCVAEEEGDVFEADGEIIIENNIGSAAVEAGGVEPYSLSPCVCIFTHSQDVWIQVPVQPRC